jgi:hypothetical protein
MFSILSIFSLRSSKGTCQALSGPVSLGIKQPESESYHASPPVADIVMLVTHFKSPHMSSNEVHRSAQQQIYFDLYLGVTNNCINSYKFIIFT